MPSPLLPFQGLPTSLPSGGGGGSRPSYFNFGGIIPSAGYNASPSPRGYNSTFGGIPGNIGIPNPFQDISSILPGAGDLNKVASSDVLSELQGQLSPETQALIQDKAAQFGISSGMPGSGLVQNRTLRDLGLTSENVQSQGLQNLARLLSSVSSTETVPPALQAEIASRNAMFNAAPVPSQAQSYAQQLFDKYLQSFRGPGGGTGKSPFDPTGGTGSFSPGQQPIGGFGSDTSGAGDFDAQGNYIGDIPPGLLTSSSSFTPNYFGPPEYLGPSEYAGPPEFSGPPAPEPVDSSLDELLNVGF